VLSLLTGTEFNSINNDKHYFLDNEQNNKCTLIESSFYSPVSKSLFTDEIYNLEITKSYTKFIILKEKK
jgi:hypothetical protein